MSSNNLIEWFRQATPYINDHRGKTFVVMLGSDAVADNNIHNLIHDIVVLHSLGIRMVIVHGIRQQLDEKLAKQAIQSQFVADLRVTDATALDAAIEASSLLRSRLERKLAMGLPNSPIRSARVKVASANVVTAKAAGVIDGVDLQHTGMIRKIDAGAIDNLLDHGNIVLLSPIGYSPSGEAFNLAFQDMAAAIAEALSAEKIIAFCDHSELSDNEGQAITELTPVELKALLDKPELQNNPELRLCLERCSKSVEAGIPRCHIMNYHADGALLMELFSVDGEGILLQNRAYEVIRPASDKDIPAILELIRPLEQAGVLVRRERQKLEDEIASFCVIEREDLIVAVAALYIDASGELAEIACIATHADYRGGDRGGTLLRHLQSKARAEGVKQLFVLTTQTADWFLEQGFSAGAVEDLPDAKQNLYNYQRNSRVLFKALN